MKRYVIATVSGVLMAGLVSGFRPTPVPALGTEQVRLVISQALPKLNGEHMQLKVVEVTYGPGESSPPHSHPCPVIGYVIEGSFRTQVKGEAEQVFTAGQSFYEAPNGVHQVSANASKDKPVKFTATFVCESDGPVTGPPKQ